MKKKLWLAASVMGVTLYISDYFFKIAMTPYHKQPDSKQLSGKDSLYPDRLWFRNFAKAKWTLNTAGLSLFANYLDHQTQKTVILLHGYMSDGDSMAGFAKMFYDFGFNVLIPDARAQGRSQGKYIGYGWVEKSDILLWIKKIIQKDGPKSQIVVMGQSMGGATAMMLSGMKLPSQVKLFIEDCDYSTVKKEIFYQAGHLAHLPKFLRLPVVEAVSGLNRLKNGFFLGEASSLKQLKKNTRPFLFIHGGKDYFVPTKMVYENYAATAAPKKLWLAPLAGHALSYPMYKTPYRKVVKSFIQQYLD